MITVCQIALKLSNFFIISFQSVVYCTYYNTVFLSAQLEEQTWSQILRFIFPMVGRKYAIWRCIHISVLKHLVPDYNYTKLFYFQQVMIVTGLDASWLQLYIFFWSVHFAAFLLTTVLLLYHINLVLQGNFIYLELLHVLVRYQIAFRCISLNNIA